MNRHQTLLSKCNLRRYTKVLSLERLAHLEDKNLLAGNILILFEREDCYDMVGRCLQCLLIHQNACHIVVLTPCHQSRVRHSLSDLNSIR